jgi:hypothetical protein
MKKGLYYIALGIFIILALGAGALYHYRKPIYLQYQKTILNSEFVCPENQTSDEYNAYLYRFIKFYGHNYPSMKLSDFLTIRYNQLIQHKCTKTLMNIANDNIGNATTSAGTAGTTMGEFGQSSSNVPQ